MTYNCRPQAAQGFAKVSSWWPIRLTVGMLHTSRAFGSGGFNAEQGRLRRLLRSGKAEPQLAVDACKLWRNTLALVVANFNLAIPLNSF
jgi:hypothetical protein